MVPRRVCQSHDSRIQSNEDEEPKKPAHIPYLHAGFKPFFPNKDSTASGESRVPLSVDLDSSVVATKGR